MKFCGNWDQYLTRTMHRKVKFHESRFFSLLLFFFLYFPILFFAASFFLPLFSYSFFLGKTDSYRKLLLSSFSLFPFFRSGLTRCRVFLSLQRRRKRTIRVNWTFGSQTMEIKIMKNGFSLFWALKQNCFFFSTTKRIEKARYSSKSFTESLTRSLSLW